MPKLIDLLSGIFNRRSQGELLDVTNAMDYVIQNIGSDVSLQMLEYNISTAEGIWLDEWGSWFGLPRLLDESDDIYRMRIIAVATKPKNTVGALAQAIRAYIGDPNLTVDVYEPFNSVFKYSLSKYDSTAYYQDSLYMRFGVVDIKTPIVPTSELVDILSQVKSAGIKIYISKPCPVKLVTPDEIPPVQVDINDWGVWFGTQFNIFKVPNESDNAYKQRIVQRATSSKEKLVQLCNYMQSYSKESSLIILLQGSNSFTYGKSKYDSDAHYTDKLTINFTTIANAPIHLSSDLQNVIALVRGMGINVNLSESILLT